MERTNIRHVTLEMLEEAIDFFSVDVSFISLKHIFPVAYQISASDAQGICLVKPQFEAGKEKVGKKGVVREPQTHFDVICQARSYAMGNGFSAVGIDFSPVKGPEGNIEFLMQVSKSGCPIGFDDETAWKVVQAAHDTLDVS